MSLATLAAAAKVGYKTFYRTMMDHSASWMQLTDPIVEDAPSHTESDIYGGAVFAAQSATPTARELSSSSSTTAVGRFEHLFKQPIGVAKDHPEIVARLSARTAQLAAWTLTKAFWTAVTTLDVTAHPEDGGTIYAAQGGGSVYFADAFTISPKSGAASFNQQNLFTGALDHSTLTAALVARAKYLDKDGMPVAGQEQKPYLITVQDLRRTGKDLLSRNGELYDGSALQSGSFADEVAGVLPVPPGVTADANDWWLWWRTAETDENGQVHHRGPVMPWLRVAPSIRFTLDTDTNYFNIIGYMEYGIAYSTFEGDVQMHKVT